MKMMLLVPIVDSRNGAAEVHASRDAEPRSLHDDLRDEDLHAVLAAFYARLADEELLEPYFAALDVPAHLPRIVDFWSTLLFHSGRYSGNAFRPHLDMPGLTSEHFARWLAMLESTVDAWHAGTNADRMKALAHGIANSMQLRLGITPDAEHR
ncbi:MAG: group III truncated hemoglobin [Gemmatimonadota bacterium]